MCNSQVWTEVRRAQEQRPCKWNSMAILPFTLLLVNLYPANAHKPNFVLFMADDLGIGEVGCFGNSTIRTPNIDRLAKEGVKLTQHITAASLCTPSRAAFLTGRYPVRAGMSGYKGYQVIYWTAVSGGLPKNETTFAKILQQQGYSTGIIGKWHLGVNCESRTDFCHHPLNHGFDYFFGIPFTLINDCEVSKLSETYYFQERMWHYGQLFITTVFILVIITWLNLINIPWKIIFLGAFFGTLLFLYCYAAFEFHLYFNCILMKNFDIVEQPMDLELKAQQIVEEAKGFIIRNKDRPFLLFVPFLHIHNPYYTSKEFRGRSKHNLYGDNIEEMDWMIGEILEVMEQEDLAKDTLTYFTSDHGAYLEGTKGSLYLRGSNGIYRGNTTWKVHYMSPRFSPEGAGACHGSMFCGCSGKQVLYHVPPLLFNLSSDPSEKYPLPSDSGLYRKVTETIQQAVASHNSTLHPVPQQLFRLNNLWNPMLQPCCGTFPFCWCDKEKNT
ncbi:arylsulfatase H-like isoform X6 [Hyperolius riggenbachi]|uniref:arylsulfatase H-like isoform X6 n=1 Tax=Hyperolius riggenbachi TaxID=752182 RepID=UPI0035A3B990